MALAEITWHPSDRQLRQFGCIALVALPLAGWFGSGSPGVTLAAGIAGAGMAALGLFAPRWLRVPFVALCLATLPIGWAVGEIVLLAIFGLVFVPIGLFFRITRRDALRRRLVPEAKTYWEPKQQPDGAAS